MKLWITKHSEVSVHDQLVAQITLGIASNDLKNGERLPSTRALARRFGIHQNTVSSAYRELASRNLVRFKQGSGVFISGSDGDVSHRSLEALFSHFLDGAEAEGYSRSEVNELLQHALSAVNVDRFLVVENDVALREILITEVNGKTGIETAAVSFDELAGMSVPARTRVVAMADERIKFENSYPPSKCYFLSANSVPNALTGETRPSAEDLIAVASGWNKFISFARLYLLAASMDPDSIISCSTTERGWQKKASQASMIICDSLTAQKLPNDERVRIFPLVSQASLDRLMD
jgi:DNA-binding transcriptional regulator YhcF (GntR family)